MIGDLDFAEQLLAAARGGPAPDWSRLDGVDATVGWPMCFLYAEQLARWPEAKCLLNVRDPDGWFDSVQRGLKRMAPVRRLRFVKKQRVPNGMLDLLEERMGGPLDMPVPEAPVPRANASASGEMQARIRQMIKG